MRINPFLPRRRKRLSDHFLLARIRAYRRFLLELRPLESDFARRTAAQITEGLSVLEAEVEARQARPLDQRMPGTV